MTPRQILFYDYVPDIVERRGPFRDAHLALLREWAADGRMLAAGALGDPPAGAIIVFDDGADVSAYVAADPYVEAGLVSDWWVAPWRVVVQGQAAV